MTQKIDLVGQRFGRLVVISEELERSNTGRIKWLCKCDCGNTIVALGLNLTKGDTKSCGCLKTEVIRKHRPQTIKDITGQRFGRLVVLGLEEERTKNGQLRWLCKCDCGNEKVITGCELKNGSCVSCGCYRVDYDRSHPRMRDLVGQRFSRLVVLEYSHQVKREHHWLCKCDCGNLAIVAGSYLKSKREGNKSCGCAKEEWAKDRPLSFKDLTGLRFGRLVVAGFDYRDGTIYYWNCKCDCGNKRSVAAGSLIRGLTRSCGCFMSEISAKTIVELNFKHGMTGTKPHSVWSGIKARCKDITNMRYGGRGIKICERWYTSFENFYEDMGDPPSDQHQIDRIDNEKGYCKENCRWVLPVVNSRNKRNTIWITIKGITKCLADWAEEYNVPYKRAYSRYRKGWPDDLLFLSSNLTGLCRVLRKRK